MAFSAFMSILAFEAFIGLTSGNVFVIDRSILSYYHYYGREYFMIPESLCNRTIGDDECGRYIATGSNEQCSCFCPRSRASFVYDGNKWMCQEDTKIRDLQVRIECKNISYFSREIPSGNLYTLTVPDTVSTTIRYNRRNGWTNCEVHLNSSWFLGCNGDRLHHSQYLSKMKELFIFMPWRGKFQFQVKSATNAPSLLQGRIINLGFKCTRSSTAGQMETYFGCLMFKLFGQLTCPVSFTELPASSTMKHNAGLRTGTPTPMVSTMITVVRPRTTITFKSTVMPTATVAAYTTSKPLVVTPLNLIATSVLDTSQTSMDALALKSTKSLAILPGQTDYNPAMSALPFPTPISFMTTSRSSTPTSQYLLRPSSGLKRSQGKPSPSLGIIAGITCSIALVFVIFVGILVQRRCHSKSKSDAAASKGSREITKEKVVMDSLSNSDQRYDDNDCYSSLRIESEEGSKMYASNYCLIKDPTVDSTNVYAPLNIPDGQNIYGHNPQEPVYNVLENSGANSKPPSQNDPISFEQPVYNVLEQLPPTPGNVTNGIEPVYNVLEDPSQGNAERSGEYDAIPSEGQIYHTLEQPKYFVNSNEEDTKEPVYNVLENDHYQRA